MDPVMQKQSGKKPEVEAGEMVEGENTPPDGGYGWVCVACNFWLNACTWGVNASFGVYLAHYLSENRFPGSTPLQYALVGGLSISQAMMVAPFTTYLNRRLGTRLSILLGSILQALSLVLASFARNTWHLFLTQGVLFGWGLGLQFISSIGVTSQWFSKKRSLANGICAAGSGIGGLAISLGSNAMIRDLGLAWSFRITAVVTFVVNFISGCLLRDRNKEIKPTQNALDLKLLRKTPVVLTLLWGFFSMWGYTVILFSLGDYGVSVGLSNSQASALVALLNVGMSIGRPFLGALSDWFGRLNVAGTLTFVTGLQCFAIWMVAKTFGALVAFALVNGAVVGTFWATISPVLAEVVDLADLPSALTLAWLAVVPPTLLAEVIGLYLRIGPESARYMPAQVFAGASFIVATGFMILLRRWKLMQRGEEKDTVVESASEDGSVHGEEGFESGEVIGERMEWRKCLRIRKV